MGGSSGGQIGRYVLYDRIASGGMAQVHLGRLVGAVGFARTVAIKRLLPHFMTDAEIVPMFVDEARLAARIRHPNVVATLDVVEEANELLLVMEYVHGESLARLLSRSRTRGMPVPPSIAVAIAISMLEGLHAAHEAKSERGDPLGIVHRDVSPQNVIVGADGTVRVVDFGIAKARGRIHTTRDGALKGKAAYIAPEQLLSGEIDRRLDIYASAVVLWETLAGERLFDGDGAPAIMKSVLDQHVVPPSHYAMDLPPALDAVVMRGLSRDPNARYTTAREMVVALEQSVPAVATSREIEAWVLDLASDVLAARAAVVAAVENESAQVFDLKERPRASDEEPTAALTKSTMELPARAPSRLPWVGAVLLLALCGAGIFLMRSAPAQPTPASPTPPTPPSAAPAPEVSSVPTTPAPVPLVSVSASSSAPKHKPPAPKVRPNCAVPFTRGPDGTKIPKPECF